MPFADCVQSTAAQPRCSSVYYAPELSPLGNAFNSQDNVPQYNYPPPVAAYDYQPLPYPMPWVQYPGQIVACYTPNVDINGPPWTQYCTHMNSLTVAPNQTMLLDVEQPDASYTHARDDTDPAAVVDQGTISGIPHMLQPIASDLDSTSPQQLNDLHTSITSSTDPLRDESTPYFPGQVAGRNHQLQRLTDAWTAAAEQSSFECDACGKDCKTRAALR